MLKKYTAIYEKRGKWYIGYIREIPGVNTQGETLSETKRNLAEALNMVLEVNRHLRHHEDTKPEKVIKEEILSPAPG